MTNFQKKLFAWFGILTLTLSLFPALISQTNALGDNDPGVIFNQDKEKLHRAYDIALLAQKVDECILGMNRTGTDYTITSTTGFTSSQKDVLKWSLPVINNHNKVWSGDYTFTNGASGYVVNSGPNLEKYISNVIEDGKISCKDSNHKLINLYLEYINKDLEAKSLPKISYSEFFCGSPKFGSNTSIFVAGKIESNALSGTKFKAYQGKNDCVGYSNLDEIHKIIKDSIKKELYNDRDYKDAAEKFKITYSRKSAPDIASHLMAVYKYWQKTNKFATPYPASPEHLKENGGEYYFYKDYIKLCIDNQNKSSVDIIEFSEDQKKFIKSAVGSDNKSKGDIFKYGGNNTSCASILMRLSGDSFQNYFNKLKTIKEKSCKTALQSEIDKKVKQLKSEQEEIKKQAGGDLSSKPGANSAIEKLEAEIKRLNGIVSFTETSQGSDNLEFPACIKINSTSIKYDPNTDTFTETTESISTSETESNLDPSSTQSGDYGDEKEACYSGAGALGWLICPVISMLDSVLTSVYGWIESSYLNVSFGDFNKNDAMHLAWSQVRNIANIIFIILFLVIIFSQVTGVGISNYGVKKTLPKLIIAAILINLSFIISMMAVDLSNIFGKTIKDFFSQELISKIPPAPGKSGLSVAGSSLVTAAIVFAIVAPNLANIAVGLVFVLTGAIAVFFMWLILVGRQVGIILAVILSPVAFTLYLLPNTQKLFDRWKQIFKSMLLVYPLCSLAIGGGMFAGRVLSSMGQAEGSGHYAFAAMIVQVLPYFIVPKLLTKSLDVLGGIGSKLSGTGRGLRVGLNKKYTNSDFNKQLQLKSKLYDPTGLKDRFAKTSAGKAFGYNRSRKRAYSEYLKTQKEEGTDGILDAKNRANLVAQIDQENQSKEVETYIAGMGEEEQGLERMATDLSSLMSKTELSDQEQLRAKALATKLARTPGGGKSRLADIARKAGNGNARKFFSDMYRTNSDINAAITKKDGSLAQYLREYSANENEARSKDYTSWSREIVTEPGTGRQLTRATQAQVKISEDADFLNQSARVVDSALAGGAVDDFRLSSIINNDNIMGSIDSDVRTVLAKHAADRGIKTKIDRERDTADSLRAMTASIESVNQQLRNGNSGPNNPASPSTPNNSTNNNQRPPIILDQHGNPLNGSSSS